MRASNVWVQLIGGPEGQGYHGRRDKKSPLNYVYFLHTPSSNPSANPASPKYFPNLFTFLHLHCCGYSAHHHLNCPGLLSSNWPSCLPNPPVASYNTQADPELLTTAYTSYRFCPLPVSLTLPCHIPPYLPQSSQSVLLLIPQHKTKCDLGFVSGIAGWMVSWRDNGRQKGANLGVVEER